MRFPHLDGRVEKLSKELGLAPDKAEWLAAAALHSGCFLRSQYCEYCELKDDNMRKVAERFVKALTLQNLTIEIPVEKLGLLTRITSKKIYRVLGAADSRHRRLASWPIMHRRLLSLDYVLDHPKLSWLPTEADKVNCFDALETPRNEIPSRVYGGAANRTVRYFANKHPIAVDRNSKTAVFVYVDSEERTTKGLESWRDEHAALWSRLCRLGFRLNIVHAGSKSRLSDKARKLFRIWHLSTSPSASPEEIRAELDELRRAFETGDDAALDPYGGLNEALRMSFDLKQRLERSSVNTGYEADYGVWNSQRIQPRTTWRNVLGSRHKNTEAQRAEA